MAATVAHSAIIIIIIIIIITCLYVLMMQTGSQSCFTFVYFAYTHIRTFV